MDMLLGLPVGPLFILILLAVWIGRMSKPNNQHVIHISTDMPPPQHSSGLLVTVLVSIVLVLLLVSRGVLV